VLRPHASRFASWSVELAFTKTFGQPAEETGVRDSPIEVSTAQHKISPTGTTGEMTPAAAASWQKDENDEEP